MTEKPSSSNISLKWGAILGLVLMLYSSVVYTASLFTQSGIGVLQFGLVVAGLTLAIREFRTQNGDFLSIGEGVGVGALVSAISGLLSSLYNVFYTTFIDPGLMNRVMEMTREQMEAQGKASDEQIDQAIEMMKSLQSPGLQIIFGVLGSVFFGVLLSLVIAAVLRRKKTDPFA